MHGDAICSHGNKQNPKVEKEALQSGCRPLGKAFIRMMDRGKGDKPNSLREREINIFN